MLYRGNMVRTLALASLLLVACTVGDPNAQPGDVDAASGIDSGGGGGGDGGGGGGGDGGGNANCEPAAVPPNGQHNPGTACVGQGCHDGATQGVPRFYLAGTLYTSAAGTTPLAGATILLPNGMGTPTKMVTASNGNFYLETPITLPVRAKASLCPNTDMAMTAMVNQPNCNAAGCHAAGNRIHLP